jgi:hypothetical protein
MKATKAEVNYRRGNLEHHCAICAMFRPPSECISVEGYIKRADLCDYFKRSDDDSLVRQKLRRAS